uniref:Out at first protein homolog n=1 Tax=Lepisosteus oculatus TaxID=7918 RepID=W5M268_LEPOC
MLTVWILPVSVRITRVLAALLLLSSSGFSSELKVRVRVADGQVAEETLEADSERDVITVEFRQGDGTLITFVADFKQDVKIFRSLILGEPERGQSQYQALCFVTSSNIRKHQELRKGVAEAFQKNPRAIRSAEEKRGAEHLAMNVAVNLSQAGQLSAHIRNVCAEARGAVYSREADVRHWLDRDFQNRFLDTVKKYTDKTLLVLLMSLLILLWQPCACSYSLRLEWYPCLLKYCRGRDAAGRAAPYKCGIRSCSKGYRFDFYVPQKQLCLWEEDG